MKRKEKRTVLLAAVAAVALAAGGAQVVPEAPAAAQPPQVAVSTLRGEGFLGWFTCYTCVGGALASTTYATALSPLFLSACLDLCEIVM